MRVVRLRDEPDWQSRLSSIEEIFFQVKRRGGKLICVGALVETWKGFVAPKARDDKTRGMTTPNVIASESKKV
jgi:hypothetical protein